MSDETKPDAGTAEAGQQSAAIVQTPATASADAAEAEATAAAITRAAHLQTARDSYKGGASITSCAEWLRLQGHDAYKEAGAAEAAIQAM